MKINIDQTQWNQWLEVKGLSTRTIKEYNQYFQKINNEQFNQERIISFLQQHNNNIARATIKNLILYLKMNKIEINVEIPKLTGRKRQRIIDILTEDQVIELSTKAKDERTALMELISFYGGLRVSELVETEGNEEYAVKPYSFNWNTWIKDPDQNGSLKIIGKGNKERKVFIPQKLMARIYQYIKNEVSKKQGKEDPLFPIGERRWKVILSDEGKKILGRHINPHLFRHSCNQWLRSKGWDITERQLYLGHENPSTTMIYDHTNRENLKEKFDQLF